MAALRISSVGRVLTRINVRPVAAIPTNVRLFATQDTVTHTGQVNIAFSIVIELYL